MCNGTGNMKMKKVSSVFSCLADSKLLILHFFGRLAFDHLVFD